MATSNPFEDNAASLDAKSAAVTHFGSLAQFYRRACLCWIDGTTHRMEAIEHPDLPHIACPLSPQSGSPLTVIDDLKESCGRHSSGRAYRRSSRPRLS